MLDGGEWQAQSDWSHAVTELLRAEDVAIRLARAGGWQEAPTDAEAIRTAALGFVTGLLQEELELTWGDVTTVYPPAALQVLAEYGMGAPEERALLRAGLFAGHLTPAQLAAMASLNHWARELAAEKGVHLAQEQDVGDLRALVQLAREWEGMPSAPRPRRRPLLLVWLALGALACVGGVWWWVGVLPPQLALDGTEAAPQRALTSPPERDSLEQRTELEVSLRAEPEPLTQPADAAVEAESEPSATVRWEPQPGPSPPPMPPVTYAITLTCPALVALGGSVFCQAEPTSDPAGAPLSLTWSTSMGSVAPNGTAAALHAGALGPHQVQVLIDGTDVTATATVTALPPGLAADAEQGGVPVLVYRNGQPLGYANAFPYAPYPYLSADALGKLLGLTVFWTDLPDGIRLYAGGSQVRSADYQLVGGRLWLKLTPALLQQLNLTLERFDREAIWLQGTN